jgi:preprotein translocase subunit SecY
MRDHFPSTSSSADEGLREPLPAHAGITNGVKLLILAGLLVSIMQGLFVGLSSPFGRVWPAADSAKVDLPPSSF